MKKVLLGMVIGIVISMAIFVPILMWSVEEKYQYGNRHGRTDGILEVISFLDKHFHNEDVQTERANEVIDTFFYKGMSCEIIRSDGELVLRTYVI